MLEISDPEIINFLSELSPPIYSGINLTLEPVI